MVVDVNPASEIPVLNFPINAKKNRFWRQEKKKTFSSEIKFLHFPFPGGAPGSAYVGEWKSDVSVGKFVETRLGEFSFIVSNTPA